MNSRQSPLILLALTSVLALQGCGDANDSTEGSSGGGGTTDPVTNPQRPIVDVVIQGTAIMAEEQSVASRILGYFLPEKALALTGLTDTLAVESIKVISVDEEGNPAGNYFSASDYSYSRQADDSYQIKFTRPYDYRIDLVVVATLEGGAVMRRMLPGTQRAEKLPHPINPATEYAMREFFKDVDAAEFEQMLPCPEGTLQCSRQPDVSALGLGALMEAVVDFEIELDETWTLDQALKNLGEDLAFARFVNQSIDSLQQKKIVGVGGDLTDPNVALDYYNSVSFSLGLNQGNPDVSLDGVTAPNAAPTTVFSNSVSTAVSKPTGTYSDYPYASLAELGLAYITGLFTGSSPVLSNRLTQSAPSSFAPPQLSGTDAERRRIGSGSVFTFLTTQGFHDFSTLQSQAVTGKEDSLLGWLTNPYFSSLYDAEAQSSLLDARLFNGYLFDLSSVNGAFQRDAILEQTNSFQFMVYSLQSDRPEVSGDEFVTAQAISGKQYGMVILAQKFAERPAPSASYAPLQVASGLYLWNAVDNNTIIESQPTDAALFNTQILGRFDDNSALRGTARVTTSTDRGYSALDTVLKNNQNPEGRAYAKGRLQINATSEGVTWEGMADPAGKLLTFNVNTAAEGQGIVHAVELTQEPATPLAGERYRLDGNGFGLDDTSNFLFHVDDSELIFNEDGTATLVMNQVRVTQDISTQAVSEFQEVNIGTRTTTAPVAFHPDYKNALSLAFPDPAGGPDILLEGFVAEPDADNSDEGGRLMVLRLRHGDSVGLVYGMRQKRLTPSSFPR